MITKSERLDRIIEHYADGKSGIFAEKLDIKPSTISSWKARDTFDIELIFAKCKNINPEWLLTGRGEMLKAEKSGISSELVTTNPREGINYSQASYPVELRDEPIAIPTSSHINGIPLLPVDAMAGMMSGEITAMEYECERYVVPAFKGAEFLIPIKGSSMYPKYSSGDIVACKHVSMSDLFFQWGKVYVLNTDQGALIKRIKPTDDPSQIMIVSDNPSYDPFPLPLTSIYSVALVIGVIRLE